jgi:signal transduction histidine kinase
VCAADGRAAAERLVGDDVSVVLKLSEPVGNINIDVGQMEQVLMNLAVNARDAILNGGQITNATREIERDETDHARRKLQRHRAWPLNSVRNCKVMAATSGSIVNPRKAPFSRYPEPDILSLLVPLRADPDWLRLHICSSETLKERFLV